MSGPRQSPAAKIPFLAAGSSELTRDGRHETALQQFRDRMTDSRSNLSDFTAVQRVRGDLSDAVQSALQSGHGKRHVYFAAYSARLTGQWRAALKDFWQLIATSLKRRAILNRYRRVMKRQRASKRRYHLRISGTSASRPSRVSRRICRAANRSKRWSSISGPGPEISSAGYWKARFSEWANLGPLLLRTQLIVLHGVRSTSFVGAFGPRFSANADSKPPTQRAAMAQQIRLSAPRNISSLKLRDPPALNIVAPSSCRKNVRMRTI